MASAEQLKALLRSHLEGDDDRFISVAMQVAAHEAKLGHGKLATDLRDIIDQAKGRGGAGSPVPIGRPRGELANLLEASYPKARLGDMIPGKALASRIDRVIREQRHAGKILDHGLSPRRKLLLVGAPGTGKTPSASVRLRRIRRDRLGTRDRQRRGRDPAGAEQLPPDDRAGRLTQHRDGSDQSSQGPGPRALPPL